MPTFVADGVTHEGNEGQARIRHLGPGKTQSERVVERQTAITAQRQHHRLEQAVRGNGLHMGQNVPPAILRQLVMQPEQRQPEQGDAEQRGPRRDPANGVGKCQAAYRNKAGGPGRS